MTRMSVSKDTLGKPGNDVHRWRAGSSRRRWPGASGERAETDLPETMPPIAGMPRLSSLRSSAGSSIDSTMKREPVEVRRGDILWIDCDPSIGVEPTRVRTCVVVSNDTANKFGQSVTVIPTLRYSASRADRAFLVDLRRPRSSLRQNRVANASMVMTYDRRRVVKKAGNTTVDTRQAIDRALAIHLGLAEP